MAPILKVVALFALIAPGLTAPISKASGEAVPTAIVRREKGPEDKMYGYAIPKENLHPWDGDFKSHFYHWTPGADDLAQSVADAQEWLRLLQMKKDTDSYTYLDEENQSQQGKLLAIVLSGGMTDVGPADDTSKALIRNKGSIHAATRDLLYHGDFPVTAAQANELIRDLD